MVCDYLEKLQNEYLEEKLDIEQEIHHLQIKLKENMEFIKMLEESDNSSYESFTPRGNNSKNKEKIQELKAEQKEILTKIVVMKEKQAKSIEKLDELQSVIKVAKSSRISMENCTDLDHESYRLTLLETQENERQRISRELHDSTVQNLTGLVHKTELCSKLMEMDPIRCKLELTMMSRTLREIINDTRQMIYNLRPMSFDDIGLDVTIERTIDKIRSMESKNITFSVEGEPYEIKPVIGITLLRIIQEACNNAVKYSEASIISVKLYYEEENIIVSIEDNGKGFDLENLDVKSRKDNSGFGLSMMKERVYLLSGTIDIDSKINMGTKITVSVPVMKKEES